MCWFRWFFIYMIWCASWIWMKYDVKMCWIYVKEQWECRTNYTEFVWQMPSCSIFLICMWSFLVLFFLFVWSFIWFYRSNLRSIEKASWISPKRLNTDSISIDLQNTESQKQWKWKKHFFYSKCIRLFVYWHTFFTYSFCFNFRLHIWFAHWWSFKKQYKR